MRVQKAVYPQSSGQLDNSAGMGVHWPTSKRSGPATRERRFDTRKKRCSRKAGLSINGFATAHRVFVDMKA